MLDGPQSLTVLRAPAGFGKTTLVSQWVRSHRRPGVWMTVDADCGTRLGFWRRLEELFRAAGEGLLQTTEGRAALDLRGRVIRLAAAVSRPTVVVVDDIDRIEDGGVLDDLLVLLRHGERIRLVVMTRTSAAFSEPEVRLEFQPQVIEGGDLCFTPAETASALAGAGALDIDSDLVRDVTAGVPFAVRTLAAEASPADGGAALAELLDQHVKRMLRRSYGRSAFGRFLLRTSPAEEFDADVAADLAQVTRPAAVRYLAQAEADGLGSWTGGRAGDPDARFTFLPLVRSALWSQLRHDGPDLANELSRRYARWSMTHGSPYSATIAAVRGGDLTLAARAIWPGFFSVSAHDSARTVAALETIPWRTLHEYPALALFLATQYGASDTGRARARRLYTLAAASARRLLQAATLGEVERFAFSVIEMVSSRMIGRTEAAVAAAGRVLQVYRGFSAAARQELDGMLASRLMLAGHQFWQAGEIGRAIEVYTEANLLAADEDAEAFTVPLLAAGAAVLGNLPLAQEWIARARRLDWPVDEKDDYLGSPYHLAEAIAALERFDLTAAELHVQAVEQTFSAYEYWAWFLPVQAFVHAARGRPHAALVRLRAAREDTERPPATAELRAVHDVVAGLLHVSAGELVLAERAVAGRSPASAGALMVKALSALASGSAEPAAELARAARSRARDPRSTAIALLLHAAATIRLGEQKVASVSLERAAAVMDLNDLRTPLAFLPPGDLRAVGDVGVLPTAWLSGVPRLFPDAAPRYDLTARETRLLTRLATSDATLADLAADLHVSVNTLRAQRASLYRKLGVRCRTEAVEVAEAAGILTDAP
ncbi:AAA family ATPase [Jiangella anatolica]|uniref:AAA family ATPase n=1 Tax=Jiangella anatolica TaxID=2670374 RepID=UPI001314EC74|nr:AAA family ATPase [Jiangella anatolica]